MYKKIKNWWGKRSFNEKLMYGLVLILVIGIATRWRFIFVEIADSFGALFS